MEGSPIVGRHDQRLEQAIAGLRNETDDNEILVADRLDQQPVRVALARPVGTVEPFGDHPFKALLSRGVEKCQPIVGDRFHHIDSPRRLKQIVQAGAPAYERLFQPGPAAQVKEVVDDVRDRMGGCHAGHRLGACCLLASRQRNRIRSTLRIGHNQFAVNNGFRGKQVGQHLHLGVSSGQVQQGSAPDADPATVDGRQRAHTVPGDVEGIVRRIEWCGRGHGKHRPQAVGQGPLEGQVELNRLRTRRHASRNVLRDAMPCDAGPRGGPPRFWRPP